MTEKRSKTKAFDFNWEFEGLSGDFIIRTRHESGDKRNDKLDKQCPIELLKRFPGGNTYVVAWFRLDSEGNYNLQFVGNRPMKDITSAEMAAIWEQLQAAQTMLDAFSNASKGEFYG